MLVDDDENLCYRHPMKLEVVDLFCGVGGLSVGFKSEGVEVKGGVDLDPSCRYPFEKNIGAPFVQRSVSEVSGDELKALYSEGAIRILAGCAPCQPFSIYTGRYRQEESEDDVDRRWSMLREFSRLIEELSPQIVTMENVPRLALHPAFKDFVQRLETLGYHVSVYRKVRAQSYGVPQRRARLVLFASKFGEVKLTAPTHDDRPATVRDAIGGMRPLEAGQADQIDRLHTCRSLSPVNLTRIKATSEGGSWRDWDASLQLACHRKAGGKSFRAVYGRMRWDEPAPVITTQCLGIGNGRFGHPQQDRAISIREAALLQSFPADFDFWPENKKVSGLHLARQIGNAVPPLLGAAVARSIKHHVAAIKGQVIAASEGNVHRVATSV